MPYHICKRSGGDLAGGAWKSKRDKQMDEQTEKQNDDHLCVWYPLHTIICDISVAPSMIYKIIDFVSAMKQ